MNDVQKACNLIIDALASEMRDLLRLNIEFLFIVVDGDRTGDTLQSRLGGNACPACMAEILDSMLRELAKNGIRPGDPCVASDHRVVGHA